MRPVRKDFRGGTRPWLVAVQLAVASAAVWPEGTISAVPASFDCEMRRLAYEYGQHLQPRQGAFEPLHHALQLNSLAGCETPLATMESATPPPGLGEVPWGAIWVDPVAGRDDSGAYTEKDSPLQTLQAAMDVVEQNGVVVLKGGTYYLTETLQLGPQHSGVTVMAAPGETPVVSGGKRLSAKWTPTSGPRGGGAPVFVADVSGQVQEVPGLHVDGRRATRARFPNLPGGIEVSPGHGSMIKQEQAKWTPPDTAYYGKSTFFKDGNVRNHSQGWYANYQVGFHGHCKVFDPPVSYWCSEEPAGETAKPFMTPSGLSVQDGLPNAPYGNPKNAIINVWHPYRWENWIFEVESAQMWQKGGEFTFSKERGGNQGARGNREGGDFFIENVWEELDHPGEFFFDKATGMLYLVYNGTGTPTAEVLVVAPQLKTLLSIQGSQSNPVKDLTIKGVSFTASAITYMEPHGVPSGGDWAMERTAAVFLQGTESVTISRCGFERLDGHAVMVSGYNRHATITDSDFAYIGGTAIAAWGITDEMNRKGYDGTDGNHPRYTQVTGNLAREVGLYEKQNSFYMQAKTAQSTIKYNVFFNGPRSGINLNDGFGGGDEIASNLIFSTCRESDDTGPINTWDRQPYLTTVATGTPSLTAAWRDIHHNFLIDNYSPQVNVDTDDGSYRYRTHDNFLVYGQFGLKTFYGGHTNHQFRNIFAYVGQVLLFWDAPMDDATANRFTNNRVILNRASGPIMVKGNHLQQCVHQVEGTNFVGQTRCPEFKNELSWATTGFPNVPVTHASVMWVLDRSGQLVNHNSGLCMIAEPLLNPPLENWGHVQRGEVRMDRCDSRRAEAQKWELLRNGSLTLAGADWMPTGRTLCFETGDSPNSLRMWDCMPGWSEQKWNFDLIRDDQIGAVGSKDHGFDPRRQTSHCSGPGQVIMRKNDYFTETGTLQECGVSIEDFQVSGQEVGSTVSRAPEDNVILRWARDLLWSQLPVRQVPAPPRTNSGRPWLIRVLVLLCCLCCLCAAWCYRSGNLGAWSERNLGKSPVGSQGSGGSMFALLETGSQGSTTNLLGMESQGSEGSGSPAGSARRGVAQGRQSEGSNSAMLGYALWWCCIFILGVETREPENEGSGSARPGVESQGPEYEHSGSGGARSEGPGGNLK